MGWLREEMSRIDPEALEWEIVIKKPYTCAVCSDPPSGARGVGFAKCKPGDSWDSELGETIAKGRAIKDMLIRFWMIRESHNSDSGRDLLD